MTRVSISSRVALLGLIITTGACQGELRLRTAPGTNTPTDMAQPLDLSSRTDGVSFADINRDMDQPIYGCTASTSACHGTDMPVKSTLKLKIGFTANNDMSVLMANYQAVLKVIKTADPATSELLLRPLKNSGLTHTGGSPFPDTNDPVYQRWLRWIQLGAKFEFVPFSSVDLAAQPQDMLNGGG